MTTQTVRPNFKRFREADVKTNATEDGYELPLVRATLVKATTDDTEVIEVVYNSLYSLPGGTPDHEVGDLAEDVKTGGEAHAETVVLHVPTPPPPLQYNG